MNTELKQQIKNRLETCGIGFDHIDVFGSIRLNVHVACKSRDTADKWASLLAQSFKGGKVVTVKTVWPAKENKNTCLLPTMIEGYRVSIAY